MSWLFSQALVEASLGENSLAGEPSAQLNVMPTAQPFWRNDKTMEPSRLSRFGLTLRLLTEPDGEAVLMSFLEGFPVRTSALQDLATDSKASAPASGVNSRGWFVKWSQKAYSWRTAQCSLVEDLESYSETWPRWGSMRDGACYPQPTLAHGICESASGFVLPTPVAADTGSWFNKSASENAALRPTLGAMARHNLWPTPTLCGNYNRKGASSTSGDGLATAVMKMLPTPTVAMCKGSSGGALTRKSGRSRENDRLDYAIEGSGQDGRLNPMFVEWLMGWPSEWTALKPLETAKFQEWQQQHGDY